MKCPYCQFRDSKVVDSRDSEMSIRRRRECLRCNRRFTTYERVEMAPLLVIKRDGRREEFNRVKLLEGIRKAADKRPVGQLQIEQLVDAIEAELNSQQGNEISSGEISEMVMSRLRSLDEIAYIRYASAYREFADIERLRDELDRLAQSREQERLQRDQLPLFSRDEMEVLLRAERA